MRLRFLTYALILVWVFSLTLLQAKLFGLTADGSEGLNLVVSVEGKISVKRKGWNGYAQVVFGTSLRPGDLLRLNDSSRLKLVCSDLTIHDISAGLSGVPCETSRSVLRMPDGSMINSTRGWLADGSFPLVLSPRKTKLLSSNPVLRWTAVEGVPAYTVIVRGSNLQWVSQVHSATEIAYPKNAPQLEPGVDYKLIVETTHQSSTREPGLGLGFSILQSAERKNVLALEKQIEDLGVGDSPTQFLIAHLYADHGLKAEAIQKLQVISQEFKVAAVARLLGDLYINVGLTRQAEASYLNAIDLSEKEDDKIGEMLVHLALAQIYEQGLGNKKAAAEHLKSAFDLANELGADLKNGITP